jgi:hypothetical protein
LARFAQPHRRRLTLVSRVSPRANLYAPPPPRGKARVGRPRTKGPKLPWPQSQVATAPRRRLRVRWYGATRRTVEVVTGTGHWYKGGEGLVAVRWVFVHDLTGTHRAEDFFTTDPRMTPQHLIGLYTGRWSIETTFQELRAHLGLETTRGRTPATVLRAAPCLLGLFSVVALLYARLPAHSRHEGGVTWSGKREVTFSDALSTVRRWMWVEWIFVACGHKETFTKLPDSLRETLLYALAPAA